MKTETRLCMEMFGRAVKYWKDHSIAMFGPFVAARIAELEVIQQELRAAAAGQEAANRGFRQEAARRGAVSAALQEWMADLARVARSLPVQAYPGVAEHFRMPRSQSYLAQQTSAMAFIQVLRTMQEIFAPRGFDAESIAQAEVLLAQIEAANGAKISRVLARIGQTQALMLRSRQGLAIVREIDAILQRALRANAALLAEWNSVSRVHRPWKKGAAPAPQSPQPVAPPERIGARSESAEMRTDPPAPGSKAAAAVEVAPSP